MVPVYTGWLTKEDHFLEQCIKTVLFFTEAISVVVTRGGFIPIFKHDGCLHSKQFINFITSLIMMVQCWRGNVTGLHLCILGRTLMLTEWRCKEAPVNRQGKRQHYSMDIRTIGAKNIEK
jgi:hypothetical protein